MKHIVLTEGKNDVRFVDALISKLDSNIETNKFLLNKHLKEEGGGLLLPKETRIIRKFVGRKDTKDILIKGEGSKRHLLKTFGNLLAELCQFDLNFTVVIDRDGSTIDSLTDSLRGNAENIYGDSLNIEVVSYNQLDSNIDLINYRVEGTNMMCDSFYCISFSSHLEDVAKINKDNERAEIEETVVDYVESTINTSVLDDIFE